MSILTIVLIVMLVLLLFGRLGPPAWTARAYPGDVVMIALAALIILLLTGYL